MPGFNSPGALPKVPNWPWNSPPAPKRSTRALKESSTYTRPRSSTATPPMPPTVPVVGLALADVAPKCPGSEP